MKKLISFLLSLFNKSEKNIIIKEKNNTVINETITVNNNIEKKESENITNMYNYNGKVILLDNGHGRNCKGKMSPFFEDGTRFYEYEFNRDIVKRITEKLDKLGVKYHVIVPELEEDIPLSTRANRANKYCNQYGKNNCLFISVHSNAAGNGKEWKNARGWSVYTTKGITKSDDIATVFWNEANKLLPEYGMTMRKDMTDGDPDYEANFTVIYKTLCPAILTENLFFDNKKDCEFLMSDEGRDVIAQIHVNAIKRICFE